MFKVTVKELKEKGACSAGLTLMKDMKDSDVLTFRDVVDDLSAVNMLWVVETFCPCESLPSVTEYETTKMSLPTNAEKRKMDANLKQRILESRG